MQRFVPRPDSERVLNAYQAIFYPESQIGGFTDIDGTVAFYHRVDTLLTPETCVLDFGCGRGAYGEDPVAARRNLRNLHGRVKRVCGVDVDVDAAHNPFLDDFRILKPEEPVAYPNASFDLILADCVVEHLADPGEFFREAHRLLRPGGYVAIRTTNRLSYVGAISSLVPNELHDEVLKRVRPERESRDSFPTLYRANTVWALRRLLRDHGFTGTVYGHESEPQYLGFHWLTYALGVLHQRLAPGCLRSALFAFGQKAVT